LEFKELSVKSFSMKKGVLAGVCLIIALLLLEGCSKKIIPGLKRETGEKYDVATFNYVYGEALRQKLLGNNGEALRFFEQCVMINPASDASYFQIAQILLGSNDTENAKKYLRKAIRIQPGNLWYQLLMANIFYQQGIVDSAAVCYENAVKIAPYRSDLLVTLSNIYEETGNVSRSREILKELSKKNEMNENISVAVIRSLIREKEYGSAKEKLQELLKENPDEIVFNALLADIYQKEGNRDGAVEVYSRLLERNPDDQLIQVKLFNFLLDEKEYDDLFAIINNFSLSEKIAKEDKIAYFDRLVKDTTVARKYGKKLEMALVILEACYVNDDLVVLLRPDYLARQQKFGEAAARLEEIVKINPDNQLAWEKLLLTYYESRDFKKLQEAAREVSTRFNRSILAKLLYADAARENRDYETAMEELRKAQILAGDNQEILIQILTLRAEINYSSGNYEEAFRNYDDVLKRKEDDLTVLNNYAYYLAEKDLRLKEAEKMARMVIEVEKDNPTFLDTYAWVLYKRGKTREAARIMQGIIERVKNENAEYFEHYGFILKKQGKCREAVLMWEKALQMDQTKENLKREISKCKKK